MSQSFNGFSLRCLGAMSSSWNLLCLGFVTIILLCCYWSDSLDGIFPLATIDTTMILIGQGSCGSPVLPPSLLCDVGDCGGNTSAFIECVDPSGIACASLGGRMVWSFLYPSAIHKVSWGTSYLRSGMNKIEGGFFPAPLLGPRRYIITRCTCNGLLFCTAEDMSVPDHLRAVQLLM